MSPPIATAVSNSNLESINNKKYCLSNSPKVVGCNRSNSPSNRYNKVSSSPLSSSPSSLSSNTCSLFDPVIFDKSYANQTLLDVYKLFDLNGIQQVSNGLMIDTKSDYSISELSNIEINDDLDSLILSCDSKVLNNNYNNNNNEMKINENDCNDCSVVKAEKQEYGIMSGNFGGIVSSKDKNDFTSASFSSNNSNFYFYDAAKKSNQKEVTNKNGTMAKQKVKGINKCKTKQNDGLIQQQQQQQQDKGGASCLKQNNLSNTYYCKSDNIANNKTTSILSSLMDNDNLLQLNCINPNQIFPYNFTLKRIKSELSDSEEEIDVVSVNLNKTSNTNHQNNKISLQESSNNNIFILKKNALKNSNSQIQVNESNNDAQIIKNELLNNNDKCSLLADILKTPMSYSSKNQATKKEPTIVTQQETLNLTVTSLPSNTKKTISTPTASSTVLSSNKIKYPIQIYPSIKDSSKDSFKNKFLNNSNNKTLKPNLVNLNHHKRSIKTNSSSSSSIPSNLSINSKKNFINNVIHKAAVNKKSNTITRNPSNLIITQRAVKVATAESIKSLWKAKRLNRKLPETKVVIGKKNSSIFSIADSEESSNDGNESDSSSSSSLSNFSTHSSGWSSPLEYSSSSESIDKSTTIMTSFDLNVLNEKLCKKSSPEIKLELNEWPVYSNISDYGYSDTCSSLCSEQINYSNNLNTSNSISNSSNGAVNCQSSSSPLKRNRSYTSGYSSDNPAEKRAFHILSERQRRNDLKKLFETLRTNVPNLSDKQKASKLTILKAAVDFLADVSAKQIKLSNAYEKEKQRHLQLIQNLKVLQANLK